MEATRVAAPTRSGAPVGGNVDFMAIDWFELAPRPFVEVRAHFGVVARSEEAIAAGSIGPWDIGGISEHQARAGHVQAAARGVPDDSFAAGVEGA